MAEAICTWLEQLGAVGSWVWPAARLLNAVLSPATVSWTLVLLPRLPISPTVVPVPATSSSVEAVVQDRFHGGGLR